LSDQVSRQDTLGHPNPLEVGLPAAAKIGQTTHGEDVWTIGYTPQRLVGVWVGYDDDSEHEPISPLVPAGLWHALMKYAHRDIPAVGWEIPSSIITVEVCYPSGLLPTDDCPKVAKELFLPGNEPTQADNAKELFLPGNEPTQADNLYRTFQINKQTGRLATVFTPLEDVVDQVFMVVPPEALDWAREVGLDMPPEDYDVVFNPGSTNESVYFSSPAMFSYMKGEIDITGTATGEEFSFYRLQVGEGLKPSEWYQIGEDSSSPVVDGQLAVWNTSGLNGLYAIQLLIVHQDQSIESAITQVTIDNASPDVQVVYPAPDQVFRYPLESSLTIQVQVSDNLGIQHVEFYVDEILVNQLTRSPFAVHWSGRLGDHVLRVHAIDLAGNFTDVVTNFSVVR
jgi:membrane carboxypeptidase/penicillin-binding protein PbpC